MEIQPEKQNLDQVFSTTIYYIDFYQREYKWTEEPVLRLLDDVFYQFEQTYVRHKDLEAKKETITARYPWYYLNTYVTNFADERIYVVDGQQRLTTLTLILIKLLVMARESDSKTVGWVERKILGYSGTELEFWMNHEKCKNVFKNLLEKTPLDQIAVDSGVTAVNMVENYRTISAYLEKRLENKHRLDTFIHYFLLRLVLINLSVETAHVPMVFEVINDRGVRLKPYEILKGKLLGQIDKLELKDQGLDTLWENQLQKINAFRSDEIDDFFRHWLKSKFTQTRKDGQRFDGEYHREIFKPDIDKTLRLEHDPISVKSFLKQDFLYYTNLYAKIRDATKDMSKAFPEVCFNALNELSSQFMLILSACKVNDPDEDIKIKLVSRGLDQLFCLLQLQGSYDSNAFMERLFLISKEIRICEAENISEVFEKHLVAEIGDRRDQPDPKPFNMSLFKPISIDRLNKRFIRYFFARIELFLARGTKQEISQPFNDLVKKTGRVNGFHIEHILARNDENKALFGNDEERFESQRNRLGAVLLLKGRDNQSSNAETFQDKLRSYAGTLLWNETLLEDSYKSKLDFRDFANSKDLSFKPYHTFGPE